jgi:hypothetical protein
MILNIDNLTYESNVIITNSITYESDSIHTKISVSKKIMKDSENLNFSPWFFL